MLARGRLNSDVSMNSESFPIEEYEVVRFVYAMSPDGVPEARGETRAIRHTIEDAFSKTKDCVLDEWERLRDQALLSGLDGPRGFEVIDTEYGYDLLVEGELVVRYLIHVREVSAT